MGVMRKVADESGANGANASAEETKGTADILPEDLVDPVIADLTAAENGPENIPDSDDDDFNGFDDDND
ncbi:MAG: hypothetical protein Q9196_007207, partial [Gyalolechia fulgens]